jgi:hypothetical protein
MGQSIDVLLYGVRFPDGLDIETVHNLCEQWGKHVTPKISAFEPRLRARFGHYSWELADQAYVPRIPSPDDADRPAIVGFYICRGYYDHKSSHRFPAMTFAEMRRREPTAKLIKRCRRRWSRFARWAREQGVEFGKPRIWRTRTEVA